jgi:hypothetical protein
MKRKQFVILIAVLVLLMQVTVYANPSGWAVSFVNEANEKQLVPEEINNEYQANITRYEYVLIALEVLEKNGVIASSGSNPFSDIYSHPYKDEIIKAYHSGLVGGYTDGTFKPDKLISRQEITALVYNLVKAINDQVTLPTSLSSFADGDSIDTWAKSYVEFSYTNQIMSGVGKVNGLDTIQPLGNATREQAIVLLLKLFNNNNLLHTTYKSYDVSGFGMKTTDEIFETARSVGFNIMDSATALVDAGIASFFYIGDDNFTLDIEGDEIEIADGKYDKSYVLRTTDLENQEVIDRFTALVLMDIEDLEHLPGNIVTDFMIDEEFVLNETKGKLSTSAYSFTEESKKYFLITYTLSK